MTHGSDEAPELPESTTDAVARFVPLYVVGDSHSLPYRNMIFRDGPTKTWMVVRSRYISGLTACDFFDASTQSFNPEFSHFLEYEGLVREGKAAHLATDETSLAIAAASGEEPASPLLLITAGDIDIRGYLLPLIGDAYDFVPPFETEIPFLDRPIVPWSVLEPLIDQRLDPLIAGLRRLSAYGLDRVYVQCVVPPTQDEARFRSMHKYYSPGSVRTKLVRSFNFKLLQRCRDIGVTAIDAWDGLTVNGALRPDLEVDGVHLPPRAVRSFLDRMLRHAFAGGA